MFNQGGNESIMSLGSATESIPFPPLQGIIRTPAQRHTSLEGVKIECIKLPHPLIPRLARVQSAIARFLIWNLIRNARKSADGDRQLATVLISKSLNHFLGTRLGNSFFAIAFPYDPSPVNLSYPNTAQRRDGTQNQTKGGERPTTSRIPTSPPNISISLFTREDEP